MQILFLHGMSKSIFGGKLEKNIIKIPSTELAQRVVKVKVLRDIQDNVCECVCCSNTQELFFMYKIRGAYGLHKFRCTHIILKFPHYENTPIQTYRKIYHQKNEKFQIKILIFFIFLLKT